MSVSAILIVSPHYQFEAAGDEPSRGDKGASPIATLKLLGKSILERTVCSLHSAGIKPISVVGESGLGSSFIMDVLLRQTSRGCKNVLLIKLCAYTEVDYVELLKFHYESDSAVTRVCDGDGPLDFWVLDPIRLIRSGTTLDSSLADADLLLPYLTTGYVKRITDARAFRSLAVDAFLGWNAIEPCGREIEPGIWIDRGARVHRSVFLAGPAYIGCGVRVRASAQVGRFSAVEECCLLDRGAVIEDATILPHSYIGKGINVAHAIVDRNQLGHLRSGLTIPIDDPRIIGRAGLGWQSFRYGGKSALTVPAPRLIDLEPAARKPTRLQPEPRIVFKGEE